MQATQEITNFNRIFEATGLINPSGAGITLQQKDVMSRTLKVQGRTITIHKWEYVGAEDFITYAAELEGAIIGWLQLISGYDMGRYRYASNDVVVWGIDVVVEDEEKYNYNSWAADLKKHAPEDESQLPYLLAWGRLRMKEPKRVPPTLAQMPQWAEDIRQEYALARQWLAVTTTDYF